MCTLLKLVLGTNVMLHSKYENLYWYIDIRKRIEKFFISCVNASSTNCFQTVVLFRLLPLTSCQQISVTSNIHLHFKQFICVSPRKVNKCRRQRNEVVDCLHWPRERINQRNVTSSSHGSHECVLIQNKYYSGLLCEVIYDITYTDGHKLWHNQCECSKGFPHLITGRNFSVIPCNI